VALNTCDTHYLMPQNMSAIWMQVLAYTSPRSVLRSTPTMGPFPCGQVTDAGDLSLYENKSVLRQPSIMSL